MDTNLYTQYFTGERSVPRNVEVLADSTRIEDQDTPDYYSDASDEVPFISRRQV